MVKKRQKHKGHGQTRVVTKTVQNDSFFNFFSPPAVPTAAEEELDDETLDLLDADYDIGQLIRDRIINRAVLIFSKFLICFVLKTCKIMVPNLAGEYLDDEEGDEDYYGEGEEGEEGEEEEDDFEEEEEDAESGRGRRRGASGSRGSHLHRRNGPGGPGAADKVCMF